MADVYANTVKRVTYARRFRTKASLLLTLSRQNVADLLVNSSPPSIR